MHVIPSETMGGGGSEVWKEQGWCDKLTTGEFQYSLKFHLLTDVSVAQLPLPEVNNKIHNFRSTRS